MKPSRIAMATLGVGAALTAGVWTLSAAAVPLPADPIAITVVGTPQPLNADPGITDPARALADAEARLSAMNGQLQALVVQRAPAVPAAAVPAAAAPTAAAAPAAAAAPPTHTVTGASGSTSVDGNDAHAEEHDSEEQDD